MKTMWGNIYRCALPINRENRHKVPKLHCAKEVSTVCRQPTTENKLPRQYVLCRMLMLN